MAIYRNLITDDDGSFAEITADGKLQVTDETILNAKDPLNSLLGTMDAEHWHIHHGEHFFFQQYVEVAGNATKDYAFNTGNKYVHLVLSVDSADAGLTLNSYENIVANDDGSVKTILNNNRPSTNVSTVTLRETPTGINTTGAVLVRNARVGTATNPANKTAGSVARSNELILKKNTKHLIRILNLSSSANNINISLTWYEEE